MLPKLKKNIYIKRLQKTRWYSRIRQYFPQTVSRYVDDSAMLAKEPAEVVTINWPADIQKPRVGLVRDYEFFPRWTKYIRFLENNTFDYEIFNLHASDWMERAKAFDVIIGVFSNELFHLDENRKKYYFMEKYMGKHCFPNTEDICLYEDKKLEAFLADLNHFPFVKTYISYDLEEALQLIEKLNYPVVSKIDPTSGSVGVELVRDLKQCRNIVNQAFSNNGRKTHQIYYRQKNYIYLQDFVPNDGYDIRVIMVGDSAFGYYRKVPRGDFRASGMDMVEKRDLPLDAMKIAHKMSKVLNSPQLVVDMVHDLEGNYQVIEYSPICQMETPMQLCVDDVPGVYIFSDDGNCQFQETRCWVHELALKEYFLKHYLPEVTSQIPTKGVAE